MSQKEVIASIGDADRAAKLGRYFREYLSGWTAELILGFDNYSDAVMHELVMALLEHAAAIRISCSDAAKDEPDEETAERAKRAARESLAILEREVLS